jgi:hypothetical protein
MDHTHTTRMYDYDNFTGPIGQSCRDDKSENLNKRITVLILGWVLLRLISVK